MCHQMESVGSHEGLDKKAAVIGGFFAFRLELNRIINDAIRASLPTSN